MTGLKRQLQGFKLLPVSKGGHEFEGEMEGVWGEIGGSKGKRKCNYIIIEKICMKRHIHSIYFSVSGLFHLKMS